MNIDSAFPSNFLKAADLGGKTARVTIRAVTMELIGQQKDNKPVLYFEGKEKGLVLNRTNSQAIAMVFGQETDDWPGGELELFTVMTDFQGQAREAIRVRIAPRKPNGQAQARQQGEVKFTPNARQRVEPAEANPPAPIGGGSILDDEIPFAAEFR